MSKNRHNAAGSGTIRKKTVLRNGAGIFYRLSKAIGLKPCLQSPYSPECVRARFWGCAGTA